MTKPKPPEMEPISPETHAKLKAIETRIDELKAQIKELEEEAYWLVPKHTFDECKAMGCDKTYRNRWDCHCSCVRRKDYHGCFHDYYYKEMPVFKPRVTYPTLGWKQVAARGVKWGDEWHGFHKVVQETDKTLLLDDAWKTRLFKSTIFTIEDVTYIKNRSGTIYFCADDPEALDIQVTLLDVANQEWCEQNRAWMIKTPDTSYPSGLEQQDGETKEEYEARIFGEDTDATV